MSESLRDLPPPLRSPIDRPLVGPRLILARYSDEHLPLVHDAISSNIEHLRPHMRWIAHEPLTLEDRKNLVDEWNRDADEGRGVVMGSFLNGQLIGSTGLHRTRPVPTSIEVGYWIDARHLGRGYATETTCLLVEEAFTHEEIETVSIYCDETNEASARVAIRAGFLYRETTESPEGERSPGESGRERHYSIEREAFDPNWRHRF